MVTGTRMDLKEVEDMIQMNKYLGRTEDAVMSHNWLSRTQMADIPQRLIVILLAYRRIGTLTAPLTFTSNFGVTFDTQRD